MSEELRTSDLVFPESWPEIGTLMSNFDHEVDDEIAAKLEAGNCVANYPGWNFHAKCWHEHGKFHARVKRYMQVVGFYSAETPKELMNAISSEYGYD